MSTPAEKNAHTLEAYGELLDALLGAGYEFSVIGGCAVGAYGRLRGEVVLSRDLDLYAVPRSLHDLLQAAPSHGMRVISRPQPRSVPTAYLTWKGMDVNVLTESIGLPSPEVALRTARIFKLSKVRGLEVPLADPFDLLRNKLRIRRPKDEAHIRVLRAFLEEEVVAAFEREKVPRERLAPARRLLDVCGARRLPDPLFERLLPLAKSRTDLGFLMDQAPTAAQARRVLERAAGDSDLHRHLDRILRSRHPRGK